MIAYFLLRLFTFPLAFLPFSLLHRLGKGLGLIAYYLIPKFRKRSLSNLALASDLALSDQDIVKIAKESIQNLMITCLEYPRLSRDKHLERLVKCVNPEEAEKINRAIFFCGHQANWELLFLEGTMRMPGVAIGRPINNPFLYQWVKKIRERFSGKIVTPKEGVKEGLKALKEGKFFGIVGDQAMPENGFYHPFLGREAWTSPLPALLSYRTGAPLFVATTTREKGRYTIRYSAPIYPDQSQSAEEEVPRLMKEALALFEEGVKAHPGQWLWAHNRWKQQTLNKLPKHLRQDSIVIVADREEIIKKLSVFRDIYPREALTAFVPKADLKIEGITTKPLDAFFQKHYDYKLLYNFTENKTYEKHLRKYALSKAINLKKVEELKDLINAR